MSCELLGQAATLDAVTSALPGAAYLRFYCHGAWAALDPGVSALILARSDPNDEQGQLTVQMLQALDLSKSRLAVLAACETGLINLRHMNEMIGLPAGLLEAGVPGVVATGWLIEARTSEALAKAFFRSHLLARRAPAEALREAQLEMLALTGSPPDSKGLQLTACEATRSATEQDHLSNLAAPFYWAAFSFTGA
jgi:CHAT domain-containing protein